MHAALICHYALSCLEEIIREDPPPDKSCEIILVDGK